MASERVKALFGAIKKISEEIIGDFFGGSGKEQKIYVR